MILVAIAVSILVIGGMVRYSYIKWLNSWKCPSCGNRIDPEERYCRYCGCVTKGVRYVSKL